MEPDYGGVTTSMKVKESRTVTYTEQIQVPSSGMGWNLPGGGTANPGDVLSKLTTEDGGTVTVSERY